MENSLMEKATSLREVSDNQRLSNHDLPLSDYAPGTLVLIQFAKQPPTRRHTKWFGQCELFPTRGLITLV